MTEQKEIKLRKEIEQIFRNNITEKSEFDRENLTLDILELIIKTNGNI